MRNLLFTFLALFAFSVSAQAEGTKIAEAVFVNKNIKTIQGTTVKTGPGVAYNSAYGHSWVMHYNGASWFEISFEKHPSIKDPLILWLIHLSSDVHMDRLRNYAPVDILINGKVLEKHYVADSGNWIYDGWDITNLAVNGKNTIRINFCDDAICNYWLNGLVIFAEEKSLGRQQRRENEWKNQ